MMCNHSKKRHSGQVSIIVAGGLSVILGVAALVSDYGFALVQQARLQQAMDSAVLAGISQLVISETAALNTARAYLALNNVNASEVTFSANAAQKTLTAQGTRTQDTWFGKLLGVQTLSVNATSGAIMGVAGSVSGGLRPYAITDRYYAYGELITLKTDSSYHGNYGSVGLGGSGANVLRDNALNGYKGSLQIGDTIYTETGNMASVVNAIKDKLAADPSTFTNYTPSSYRLWTIPVVNTLTVNGSKPVVIRGFAQVFVENVVGKSGKMEIVGRFTKFVGSGEIDPTATDFGVYVSKLYQ